MEPRRHSISLPNIVGEKGKHEIVFYDWGDVDAKHAVVCVHGLTRNARDFDFLAPALAECGRRVFTINMAGRGESAWLADPTGYVYLTYVSDCIAIMDNFHLRQVDWIGTSMGGIVGMMLAATREGRIRKLVLNDVGTFLGSEALERIFTYVTTMPKSFASRDAASAYLSEVFKPFGITDPALWQRFVDTSLLAQADGSFRLACDPAILEPVRSETKNFTEIKPVALSDLWEKITIPALIVHGENSDVLSADTVRVMKGINPRAESVTIKGVGHAPALMTQDQIDIVVNWLLGASMLNVATGL